MGEIKICDCCEFNEVKWDEKPCCLCAYGGGDEQLYKAAKTDKTAVELAKAKAVVIAAGYTIIKITETMEQRMNECVDGTNEDCLGCSCSVCVLQEGI